MTADQLIRALREACAARGLRLDNVSDGYELCQDEHHVHRTFLWEPVRAANLDFANSDPSGEHAVRVLHGNDYDEYNTNTLKKNLRNALRLLSGDTLFGECAGCENCEWEVK